MITRMSSPAKPSEQLARASMVNSVSSAIAATPSGLPRTTGLVSQASTIRPHGTL